MNISCVEWAKNLPTLDELQQRAFGNDRANDGVNQLLYAVKCDHLANGQVDHECFQTIALLQGAVPIGGELTCEVLKTS